MAYLNIPKADLHLEKQIGEGGFSAVFQAKWNDRHVAAKRLHKPDQHEVEVLSKLDHPNIVKLIGVCDDPDNLAQYLVLELCSGGSLRSFLDQQRSQKKRLPTKVVYDWAKQAAKPIQYLNQMKIVHKDVKSPNYLIAAGDVLKLADFGLAKEIEFTIKNATDRASHPWMAPELLTDGVLSPSYDIHAYGVVVWELCTSEFPFEGSEPHHVIWRVCNDDERPVIPPDCPKALADLMRQCWEKDWKKRPTIDHILMMLTFAEMNFNLTNRSWVLEREIGQNEPGKLHDTGGITVSPRGQIAVADYGTARIQVYSAEGQLQLSIDTTKGLMPGTTSRPWNVAVSSEGDCYVADNTRFIKAYDSSGMYKDKWVAVSPDSKPSDTEDTALLGLAMDSKGQLLVGEVRQKYISIHRQDGMHITSIRVNIRPHSLAVTSQDTIIISEVVDEVQIVDITGHVLHSLKPLPHVTSWQPRGVCCYEDITFICNWTLSHHGIYCFSSSGEYLSSIDTKKIPHCVAVGNDKLYVAYEDRVGIFSCQ